MPPKLKPPFHARIPDPEELHQLAEINRRTTNTEVLIAIENHIESNRALLKSGKRMPKGRKP